MAVDDYKNNKIPQSVCADPVYYFYDSSTGQHVQVNALNEILKAIEAGGGGGGGAASDPYTGKQITRTIVTQPANAHIIISGAFEISVQISEACTDLEIGNTVGTLASIKAAAADALPTVYTEDTNDPRIKLPNLVVKPIGGTARITYFSLGLVI